MEQASSMITAERAIPAVPIQFIPITEYTTFRAEMAIVDGDLVFHFYITEEANERATPAPHKYWLVMFPVVLSKTAEKYFNAEFPRLKAAYTEEQKSWWMRAFGFGQVLDPHKMGYGFLAALDTALDEAITSEA